MLGWRPRRWQRHGLQQLGVRDNGEHLLLQIGNGDGQGIKRIQIRLARM